MKTIKQQPNVGKYTLHGSYGIVSRHFSTVTWRSSLRILTLKNLPTFLSTHPPIHPTQGPLPPINGVTWGPL